MSGTCAQMPPINSRSVFRIRVSSLWWAYHRVDEEHWAVSRRDERCNENWQCVGWIFGYRADTCRSALMKATSEAISCVLRPRFGMANGFPGVRAIDGSASSLAR